MKKLLFILLLSSFTIGCQDCSDIQIYGEQEDMLLDSIQKNNVKTGCDVCDKQIKNTNINSELEKLNSEFTIAKGSYSYYKIQSSLKGINYSKIDKIEYAFSSSNSYKDSLTVIQLNDSIKISFFQEILGGCVNYIPNLIKIGDSLIIKKIGLPNLSIYCQYKKMNYDFAYYSSINAIESVIVIDRKLIDNQNLFFQPYKNLIFNIPTDKDTVYFNKD